MAIAKKNIMFYILLLVILTVFVFLRINSLDIFSLIRYVLLIIFAHIAAVGDLREKRVSNYLVLTMFGAWVLVVVPQLFWDIGSATILLSQSAIGFITGGGLFMILYIISRKGVGGGDVKFMAAAGLYLTFYGLMQAMVYGTLLAGITASALLITKRVKKKDTIPLLPFLYVGIILSIFLVR